MSTKSGRPRKYAMSKERYTVHNKKRPVMRVSPEEKEVLEYLRKNPIYFQVVKNRMNNVVTTNNIDVTTNNIDVTTFQEQINLPISWNKMCEIIDTRGYEKIFSFTRKRSRNKKVQWRYLCKMGIGK